MTRYLTIRPAPWARPGPVTYSTPCVCDQFPGVWEYPAGWAGLALRLGWQMLVVHPDQAVVRDPREVLIGAWAGNRASSRVGDRGEETTWAGSGRS